jgi:hypothetical protein
LQTGGRFSSDWFGPGGVGEHPLFPGQFTCFAVTAHYPPLTLEFGQLVKLRGAGDQWFAVWMVGKGWGATSARVVVVVEVPHTLLRNQYEGLTDRAWSRVMEAAIRALRFTIVQFKSVEVTEPRESAPEHVLCILHMAWKLVRIHVPASLCTALTSRACAHLTCTQAADPEVLAANIKTFADLDPTARSIGLVAFPPDYRSQDPWALSVRPPNIELSADKSGGTDNTGGTPDGPAAAVGRRNAARNALPAAEEMPVAKKGTAGGAAGGKAGSKRTGTTAPAAPPPKKPAAPPPPAANTARVTRNSLAACPDTGTQAQHGGKRGGAKGASVAKLPEMKALATAPPQRAKSPDVPVIGEPSAPPAQKQPQQEPQAQVQTQRQPLHDITGAAQHNGMQHNGMLVPIHQLGGAPLGGLQLGHVGVGAGMQPWPMMPHGGSMALPMLMTSFHAQNAAAAVRAAQDEARAATQNQLLLACMYGGQWCGPPQGAPPFQDAPK